VKKKTKALAEEHARECGHKPTTPRALLSTLIADISFQFDEVKSFDLSAPTEKALQKFLSGQTRAPNADNFILLMRFFYFKDPVVTERIVSQFIQFHREHLLQYKAPPVAKEEPHNPDDYKKLVPILQAIEDNFPDEFGEYTQKLSTSSTRGGVLPFLFAFGGGAAASAGVAVFVSLSLPSSPRKQPSLEARSRSPVPPGKCYTKADKVWIPKGTYRLGSNLSLHKDEMLEHRVALSISFQAGFLRWCDPRLRTLSSSLPASLRAKLRFLRAGQPERGIVTGLNWQELAALLSSMSKKPCFSRQKSRYTILTKQQATKEKRHQHIKGYLRCAPRMVSEVEWNAILSHTPRTNPIVKRLRYRGTWLADVYDKTIFARRSLADMVTDIVRSLKEGEFSTPNKDCDQRRQYARVVVGRLRETWPKRRTNRGCFHEETKYAPMQLDTLIVFKTSSKKK